MTLPSNAGNAILALSTTTGAVNWLGQANEIVTLVVGVASLAGIAYSIVWHRVRIRQVRKELENESK